MARIKQPMGQKNHVLFIKKPAVMPTERTESSPKMKSQLLV
jgi:hypothetical protein